MNSNSVASPDIFAESESEYVPSRQSLSSEISLFQYQYQVSSVQGSTTSLPSSRENMEQNQTKKRKRNPENWKRNIRKKNRNSGKEYTSCSGVSVPEKKFKSANCGCKNKCTEKFSVQEQKHIFQHYYGLENFNLQTAFLFGSIKIYKTKRVYTKNSDSKRKFTRNYFFKKNGSDIQVCQKFFKFTLQVSDGRITRAVSNKGIEGGVIAPVDKRGKHPPENKTSEEKIKKIVEFINKIPAYQSHYSRNWNAGRKYLSPYLNISKLYDLYKCSTENCTSKYVFTEIFNRKFNLHFGSPASDTCNKCDILNNKIKFSSSKEEKAEKLLEKDEHLLNAENARKQMKIDVERAKHPSNDLTVIVFDLMKTLPTPILTTNACYYKRQLWTYCLGVHNLGNNQASMYVWDETVASRGADDVASCLLHYVKENVITNNLIMYSDQCGGQNKNIKMSLACLKIVLNEDFLVNKIEHKFLVPGHSYLRCDQDFGLIEKNKKFFKHIFIPSDWIEVIKTANKKLPFNVVKMKREDFFSSKPMESTITRRKKDERHNAVNWFKIQYLKYEKDYPCKIFFKYAINSENGFSILNIEKRSFPVPDYLTQTLAYPNGRTILPEKKKDLIELTKFIPPIHHAFYQNLKSASSGDEIIFTESENEE